MSLQNFDFDFIYNTIKIYIIYNKILIFKKNKIF